MYETTMKEKCGFQGTIPYWDWRAGTCLSSPKTSVIPTYNLWNGIDAQDVSRSPLFDEDPVTGLGGFGDPTDNNFVKTGGFAKTFRVSYPEPNPLRRLYTIQPYANHTPSPLFPEPTRLANSTFTYEKVAEALTCGAGDYSCLQTHVEGMQNMHGGGELLLSSFHCEAALT